MRVFSALSFFCMFFLAACAGAGAGGSIQEPKTQQQPNILWIVAEDVSPWVPAFGDNTVATPNMQRLAQEGVVFTKAFAPNPICSPTRSALMLGKYPTTAGVHHHRLSRDGKGRDAVHLPKGELTLPELFQEAGYNTFNIGKDDYNFVYNRRDMYNKGPDGVEGHIGELMGPSFDWTAIAKDGPFFGQIQIDGGKSAKKSPVSIDPDTVKLPPYYPDTALFRKSWARHYENIATMDKEVGQILQKLDSAGLSENTIVFVFADHGMLLLRHKQFLYDGGLQVPVYVSYPKNQKAVRIHGERRDDLISLIDLSAASLDLAGIEVPDYFEGQALFAQDHLPRGYIAASRDRADYTFDRIRAIRTQNFKYIRNYLPHVPYLQPQYRDRWPLTKEYKALGKAGKLTAAQMLFLADKRPTEELYDLRVDPHEIHNLAGNTGSETDLARLSGLMDLWIESSGDKGLDEETTEAIGAVVARWGKRCVDPRCNAYRAKYGVEPPSGAVGVFEGQARKKKHGAKNNE